MIEGGCLCGGVRYQLTGRIGQVANCHCNMCRRHHGAAFGTYAELGRSDVRWTQGDALVKRYASSKGVERLFCKRCGSTLQFLFDLEPDKVYVTLGTMDGDPGVRPEVHIYAASKAPWHEITDDLPQYDEWTDDFQPGK